MPLSADEPAVTFYGVFTALTDDFKLDTLSLSIWQQQVHGGRN